MNCLCLEPNVCGWTESKGTKKVRSLLAWHWSRRLSENTAVISMNHGFFSTGKVPKKEGSTSGFTPVGTSLLADSLHPWIYRHLFLRKALVRLNLFYGTPVHRKGTCQCGVDFSSFRSTLSYRYAPSSPAPSSLRSSLPPHYAAAKAGRPIHF